MATLEERLKLMKLRNKKQAKELSRTAHSAAAIPSADGLQTPLASRQNKTAPELGNSRNPLDTSNKVNSTVDPTPSSSGDTLLSRESLHLRPQPSTSKLKPARLPMNGVEISPIKPIEEAPQPKLRVEPRAKLLPPVLPQAVSALKKPERVERRRSRSVDSKKTPVKKKEEEEEVAAGDLAKPAVTPAPMKPLRPSISTSSLDGKRIDVNGRTYLALNLLGRGGSSQVFAVYDETQKCVAALKCVDLSGADDSAKRAYRNEINLLRDLQGSPHVITMMDYEEREDELLVLMEKGDTDLSTFLRTRREKIDVAFIRYHWAEMLRAVKVIHERNIVHSDLKPANFLLVKGNLKLIDFGIASSIPSNKTSVTKETQMGTLSYMSPESINGEEDSGYKVPLKSDVWSLGCILYSVVYGRKFRSTAAKMRAITSEAVKIQYPSFEEPQVVDVMKRCLVRSVKERADINELLEHPFITGQSNTENVPDIDFESLSKQIKEATPKTSAKLLKSLAASGNSKSKMQLNFDN